MLDLQPIKDRLAAATPGPWTRQEEYDDPEGGGKMYLSTSICDFEDEGFELAHARSEGDADLIADAPTDLAALVAEVERLRAAIASHKRRGVIDPQPWDRDLWEVLQ